MKALITRSSHVALNPDTGSQRNAKRVRMINMTLEQIIFCKKNVKAKIQPYSRNSTSEENYKCTE
ncbi:hypothetical protein SESBI_14877 [Sesbania bispinosa]|nr:hypothetical protein SESBI_14877 [Sesbania bispinosa]